MSATAYERLPAELRHKISGHVESNSSFTRVVTQYTASEIALDVPRFGKSRQQVTCGVCGKLVDVVVTSSFIESIKEALLFLFLLALFGVPGLFLSQMIDAAVGIFWAGWALLFGLCSLFFACLATTLVIGAGPEAKISGDKADFGEGADHDVKLQEPAKRIRARRRVLLGSFILWLVLGYAYYKWQVGTPVDGDILVGLVGSQRDDPEVRSVLRKLGRQYLTTRNSETEGSQQRWLAHRLTFHWDGDDRLERVEFGSFGSPYVGQRPTSGQ